jgi:hypothetical protein
LLFISTTWYDDLALPVLYTHDIKTDGWVEV